MRRSPWPGTWASRACLSGRLFRKGKAVEQLQGMQTEADDRALIERHILPLAEKEVLGADDERVRDLRRLLFDQ
jgi:hypothetical protein